MLIYLLGAMLVPALLVLLHVGSRNMAGAAWRTIWAIANAELSPLTLLLFMMCMVFLYLI
jgi:hypothetical protein